MAGLPLKAKLRRRIVGPPSVVPTSVFWDAVAIRYRCDTDKRDMPVCQRYAHRYVPVDVGLIACHKRYYRYLWKRERQRPCLFLARCKRRARTRHAGGTRLNGQVQNFPPPRLCREDEIELYSHWIAGKLAP